MCSFYFLILHHYMDMTFLASKNAVSLSVILIHRIVKNEGMGREPLFSGSRPMDFTAKSPKSRRVAEIFASPSDFQSRFLGHVDRSPSEWHRFRRPQRLFSALAAHKAISDMSLPTNRNRKERKISPPLSLFIMIIAILRIPSCEEPLSPHCCRLAT